jgi:hypothetical protein
MVTQHVYDMQGNILCEQQSAVTKFGFLEMPSKQLIVQWRQIPPGTVTISDSRKFKESLNNFHMPFQTL